jgi:hypothetical protein
MRHPMHLHMAVCAWPNTHFDRRLCDVDKKICDHPQLMYDVLTTAQYVKQLARNRPVPL